MGKVEFRFPVKGKDTNNPIEKQPLLTSSYLENVRPYDQLEIRMRGGQRPGCRKWGLSSPAWRIGGNYRIDKLVAASIGTRGWIEDNQMTWLLVPYVLTCGSISMAATAVDASYGVEYDFDCTTDDTYDSGWQDSNVHTITGLTSETTLTFRCRAREKSPGIKVTEWSSEENITPNAKPQPDPMTWATEPYLLTYNSIKMIANTATDPSGVEYYFTCESGAGGSDSGWQAGTDYTDTGLTAGTQYCYTVKARDKSGLQCENTKSATKCATTYPSLPGTTTANVWKTVEESGSLYVVWSYDTGGVFATGIAVDSSGNVYVAGTRSGNKSVWKLNSSGSLVWDYDTGDNTIGIAVDSSGNVYVAGTRSGNKSVWKLDSSGGLVWDYDTGDHTVRIAVDSSGNVYVAGWNGTDSNDFWKLNSSGVLQWDYNLTANAATGVTVDDSGNVFVASDPWVDEDENDGSVRKLNSSGVLQWCYDADGNYVHRSSHGNGIVLDGSGNVYTALTQNRDDDATVWKLNGSGSFQWSYDTGANHANGIALDDLDNVFIAGVRANNVSIWKLDNDGNLLWSDDTGDDTGDIYHDGTFIYIAGDRT